MHTRDKPSRRTHLAQQPPPWGCNKEGFSALLQAQTSCESQSSARAARAPLALGVPGSAAPQSPAWPSLALEQLRTLLLLDRQPAWWEWWGTRPGTRPAVAAATATAAARTSSTGGVLTLLLALMLVAVLLLPLLLRLSAPLPQQLRRLLLMLLLLAGRKGPAWAASDTGGDGGDVACGGGGGKPPGQAAIGTGTHATPAWPEAAW